MHTHYMHIASVQLFVPCRVSFVNSINTRPIASNSDAVYTTDEVLCQMCCIKWLKSFLMLDKDIYRPIRESASDDLLHSWYTV
jgi:hypothetical protein